MKVTKKLSISAAVASLYIALTLLLSPIGYGPVQLRVAEALTILPICMPSSVWGLFVGCLLSNAFMSPYGIYDVIIGSAITLIAGLLTSRIKNVWLGAIPPIILNALFLPLMWVIMKVDALYWYNVFSILVSQSIALYLVGVPLHFVCKKSILPLIDKDSTE